MFVYCLNSPLQHIDIDGQSAALVGKLGGAAMLPLLDGPLPFGDVLFSILVICSLGRYLREKNAAVSKVTVNSIDWGKGDHNHILKGTNRKHVKGWKRFGIDPDGGNSWPMLLPILKEVIENADKTESMTLLNGNTIIRYYKLYEEIGVEVMVKIWVSADGLIQQLSDAIPYIQ